jgi:hypothetical protein
MHVAGTVSRHLPNQQAGYKLEHSSPPPSGSASQAEPHFTNGRSSPGLDQMAPRAVTLCEATPATGRAVSRER